MKVARNSINHVVLIVVLLALFSCKSQKKEQQSAEIDIEKETIEQEVTRFVYPLPSPFALTEMLNDIEASYLIGISNDPSNVENYFITRKRGLNLGIYSSDLAYASTYNMNQEVVNYMNSIRKLLDALDITGAVDESVLQDVQDNLGNKEKLVEIITGLIHNTYVYLKENDKEKLSSLILAGTWLEGMYLATHVSESTYDNIEIIKIIMKQKEPLKDILKIIEPYQEDSDLKEVYAEFSAIDEVYDMQEGSSSLSVSQMKSITEKVSAFRNRIIE